MEGCFGSRTLTHLRSTCRQNTAAWHLFTDAVVASLAYPHRAMPAAKMSLFSRACGRQLRCSSFSQIQPFIGTCRGQHRKPNAVPINIAIKQKQKTVDPDITLYNKSTQHSAEVFLDSWLSNARNGKKLGLDQTPAPGSTVFTEPVVNTQKLVDAALSDQLRQALQVVEKKRDDADSPEIQSVDDLMYQEIKPTLELSQLPSIYARLAKMRLTGLVVITTMSGYAMAPGAFELKTFLLCCLGTALTSASANTINQFLEVPYDAQMNRTKTRPIVKGLVSPLHAVSFASVSAAVGGILLAVGVNPLTAGLGMFNLALYTMAYTPMKRLSIANTWVGSVVGAVPPMMGWAASAGTLHSGAWLLAALMFAWQFPHFCALSWNLQKDYSRAGYRMMSVIDPGLCQRTSLRYSIVLTAVCLSAPYFDLTTWTFAADSLPLNAALVYLAWKFYRDGDSSSSRKLFRFSLVHLPALLVLMLISKKHFGQKVEPSSSSSLPSSQLPTSS